MRQTVGKNPDQKQFKVAHVSTAEMSELSYVRQSREMFDEIASYWNNRWSDTVLRTLKRMNLDTKTQDIDLSELWDKGIIKYKKKLEVSQPQSNEQVIQSEQESGAKAS